ncbi:MAG TPA: hypothetical protein VMZ22_00385 [Acidimicrobiales bacterium]|nr:hypothetical protein [Acidimicrobiales bacterium]
MSFARLDRRRAVVVLGIAVLIAGVVGVMPAKAAVPFSTAAFSGSAVGSTVHTDALASGTTRVVNADIALASSAVNSKGLTTQATNENGRVVNPALGASKFSYGRGQGLEVGIAGETTADGQILLAGKSEVSAPPTAHDSQQIGPVDADPIAWASLAQGTSDARWNAETCILGEDISRGIGYVADAQLVDTGADDSEDLDAPLVSADTTDPFRDVSQTTSREFFSPNSKGAFGLKSQVSQTIAPVTLFRGTPNQLTIEVAGEWVLTAFATGVPGESKVSYLPSKTDAGEPVGPLTPIVRIIQAGEPATILAFQDIFGDTGLDSIVIPGVAEIAIGEDPRAIGGDASTSPTVAADGTSVSAAVDVVRVKLADGALGDIRVGHMEVRAAVPAGGVDCPIPVTKSADPSIVNSTTAPDGRFVTTITIKNAFACPLENVSLIDEVNRKSGDVTFEIDENDARNDPKKGAGATFKRNSATSATATYPNLGTIPVGGSKVVKVVTRVLTGGGTIEDIATAKGTLKCAEGSAMGQATVNLVGSAQLITTVAKVLARTGGSATLALAAATIACMALVSRRILRTRTTR